MAVNRDSKFHLIALVVWLALGVPTLLFWKDSLIWVVLMSWYAIVASHWAAYVAGKAEEAAS